MNYYILNIFQSKKISLGDTTEFDHLWACLVQHSFAIIEMDDKATLFTNLNDFRNKITEFWKLSYDIKKKNMKKKKTIKIYLIVELKQIVDM